MITVNGRSYPFWSQFVEKKTQWIGGILQDFGDDIDRKLMLDKIHPVGTTSIVDIKLRPNGKDSAFFEIIGERFTCGFSTEFGGVIPGEDGWTTFSGFGSQIFRIKIWEPQFTTGQHVNYDDGRGTFQNGRVKGFPDGNKKAVWVVYHCNGDWDFFMNYTGILSEIKYLKHGWREK